MYYCVITDASFLSDLLNQGDIWQCNLVTAKWVVDHGYGYFSDAAGDAATPPWDNPVPVPAPTPELAYVTDGAPNVVLVNFTGGITITDSTGVSVTIDAVPATVTGVSGAIDILSINVTETILADQVLLVTYAGGNLVASGEGNAPVADFADLPVTNGISA